ncbi:AMP-binding protein [Actinomadura algeriensis]|uniref:Pimeloyl-ACP methyl ester carboxylesterase n=1 Tax=Actinomadura algeriensis TaxID=1679523 RepID=A0ABR9K3H8_9ACTN|nr:AMP-binding protein [Actinomadura algeriensis]MBE1536895.1 pimeloyl-ACP methyl ester carboxylesterase [Actinomadura algeriensis]
MSARERCLGGTTSMMRRWDPGRLLHMIERDRLQTIFLVPTHAHALRRVMEQAPRRHDLSSLETIYCNAAALPVPLKEWVIDAFPRVGVHELYGSTEAGVVTNLRPPDALRKAGTVGHPWWLTEVTLLAPDGREAGPGEPGELFSRSPFTMLGYLDDPEATAEALRPDGFLTSGDVAVRDEEGFISIVDRTKDMIVSGDWNPDVPRDLLHLAVVELMRVADRYAWAYQAAFRYDPSDALAALDVPVLLLNAEFDLAAKDATARDLARDARLVVLPGLPGQPHLRAPGDFAAALLAFVRGTAADARC